MFLMKTIRLSYLMRLPLFCAAVLAITSSFIVYSSAPVSAEETDVILGDTAKEPDFSELYAIIKEERKALEIKKKELQEEGKRLKALQSDITKEYKKLITLQKELEVELSKKGEKQEIEIKNIVKLYEAMSPEEAAKALEKMELTLAAQLISQINPRKSGKILDAMDTIKVKEITKAMFEKQKNK